MGFRSDETGRSSASGMLILASLSLVLTGLLAAVAIQPALDLDEAPHANIAIDRVDNRGDRVYLTHLGGSSLDLSEIDVVVEVNGEEASDGVIRGAGGDGSWAVGERISVRTPVDPGDRVRVRVVHGPSDSLIAEVSAYDLVG